MVSSYGLSRRVALWAVLLPGMALNVACGDGEAASDGGACQEGPSVAYDANGAACDSFGGTELTALKAPMGEGYSEVVIVAAGAEAAVAYARSPDGRTTTVEIQRITLEGAPLGAPVTVHSFESGYGQLASGGFYGGLTMATDGSRYMLCWGEAFQLGCAALGVGSGDISSSAVQLANDDLVRPPNVVHGASGWFAFYEGLDPVALALDDSGSPVGALVSVPSAMVTATTSGFAVVENHFTEASSTSQVTRLGLDFAPVGGPIDIDTETYAITEIGDAVSVVGRSCETRISPSNERRATTIADKSRHWGIAVAPRQGSVGAVWQGPDGVSLFRAVDAEGHASPPLRVACTSGYEAQSITSTSDGFLIAALDINGAFDGFYNTLTPTIRVLRVPAP